MRRLALLVAAALAANAAGLLVADEPGPAVDATATITVDRLTLPRDVLPDLVDVIWHSQHHDGRTTLSTDGNRWWIDGRDPQPETAAALANTAAVGLVAVLDGPSGGGGTFTVQRPAQPPAEPDRTPQAVAAGLASVGVMGVAVVVLVPRGTTPAV